MPPKKTASNASAKQSTLSFAKKRELTAEQQAIVSHPLGSGEILLVNAFAGTGKTSTCEALIKANPEKRILYTVFNKAMQISAMERMAEIAQNLTVKTTHSMALAFCKSLAPKASFSGAELPEECRQLYSLWNNEIDISDLNDQAHELWHEMRQGLTPYPTHQAYYYVFAENPEKTAEWIDACCDLLIVDEAQDTDAGLLEVLRKITVPLIVVGDQHQDIYGFRHTVNALDKLRGPNASELALTHSFRFGQAIADLANQILGMSAIRGLGLSTVQAGSLKDGLHSAYPSCTLLCRTNAQVFAQAEHHNGPLHILGNVFQQLDKLSKLPKEALKRKHYKAERDGDEHQASMIKILIDLEPETLANVKAKQVPEKRAKLVIGTVHSAKGLEWDCVVVNDDVHETSLQYIAATRAKRLLIAPKEFLADE